MTGGLVFVVLAVAVLALVGYGLIPSRNKQITQKEPKLAAEPVSDPAPPLAPVKVPPVPLPTNQAELIAVKPELAPVIKVPLPPPPSGAVPPASAVNQLEKEEKEGDLPVFDGLCVACRTQPMEPIHTTFLCETCNSLPEFLSFRTDTDLPVASSEVEIVLPEGEFDSVSAPQETDQPLEKDFPEILVNSSVIFAVLYYPDHKVLHIRLVDGSVYRYFMVPQQAFDGLMRADSKGNYYHTHICGVYRNKQDIKPRVQQNNTPRTQPVLIANKKDFRPGYCLNHPDVRAMPDGSGLCYECNR